MGRGRIALALAALGMVAGCATQPETRVTRFFLSPQIARGQIAVEPMTPGLRDDLEFRAYADAVGAELAKIGFTEAPGLHASEQVAAISIERGTREGPRRPAFSIGLGGGSYGYRGGVGGGVAVPVGGGRAGDLAVTRLVVQIKRRSDASVVWEGRAETAASASSPAAQPVDAVRRLAAALFQGFPGVSGRTITVR